MDSAESPSGTIILHCACGSRLKFPAARVGKSAPCAACKRPIRVVTGGEVRDISKATARLTLVVASKEKQFQFFLAGSAPVTVGKLRESDLCLPGKMVSRQHCRLIPTKAGWRLEDAGSRNGVFVNGERVIDAELYEGDKLKIGDFVLRYSRATAKVPKRSGDLDDGINADGTFRIREDPDPADDGFAAEAVSAANVAMPVSQTVPGEARVCPSCRKELAASAKICVDCGINLKTGKAILTSQETNLDEIYVAAESLISILSWVFWVGLYPIASEAFGTRKPYFIRTIALVTVVTSFWFLAYEWTESPKMQQAKLYMLWAGDGKPDPETLAMFYAYTGYGDSDAFFNAYNMVEVDHPELSDEDKVLAAHNMLSPSQKAIGTYQPKQLITHAFLHGGIVHLAGNMLFLLVFGSRVNALIGNILTLILYPILAIAAGWAHAMSVAGNPPSPMLGASGAIMGLAGVYFVLFPMHKVHMAAWYRWGLLGGFGLSLRLWAVRGLWVVLFYIAFDVAYTIMEIDDGTAHWAHLGGFIMGIAIGLVLVCGRLVNARGGDLITALFGRYAWKLVGRPGSDVGILQRLP